MPSRSIDLTGGIAPGGQTRARHTKPLVLALYAIPLGARASAAHGRRLTAFW
jgi:hypothetical protein